jgi:hypothetical protein
MQLNSPNRRVSAFKTFAVLLLAFTVLGWGTGYKLSLYHRPGCPSSSIPVAKLLSQKERPSATRLDEAVLLAAANHQSSIYYPALIMVTLAFGLRFAMSTWMRETAMDDSRRQRFSHSNFFFFRPPPLLFPSN